MLLNMSACPFCSSGHNTPCFATYDDGYHCFTCGKRKSQGSMHTAFLPRSTQNNKFSGLPVHTNNPDQFSTKVLQWLYKYYIFDEMIKKYRIGYIPTTDSLLFPVFDNSGSMVFYQIRGFDPKSFLSWGRKETLIIPRLESRLESTLVIVEDFISSIRVAQYCDVLLLAGTSASNTTLLESAGKYNHFIVWLDSDKPGQESGQKLLKRLFSILEYRTQNTAYMCNPLITLDQRSTELDPKCYSDLEINDILRGI